MRNVPDDKQQQIIIYEADDNLANMSVRIEG